MKNLIIAILCYIVSIFVGLFWTVVPSVPPITPHDHYDNLILGALAVTTLGYLMLGIIFTYKYIWQKTNLTNSSKNTGRSEASSIPQKKNRNALVHGNK